MREAKAKIVDKCFIFNLNYRGRDNSTINEESGDA
jgi:hypothetical protein